MSYILLLRIPNALTVAWSTWALHAVGPVGKGKSYYAGTAVSLFTTKRESLIETEFGSSIQEKNSESLHCTGNLASRNRSPG